MSSGVRIGPISEGDITAFAEYLRKFTDGELRRLHEHFSPDLVYVIENEFSAMHPYLMREKVIAPRQAKSYVDLVNRGDSTKAAQMLVSEVHEASKEIAIGLWKSLFALRSGSSHPNLHGMIEEMLYNGPALLEEILLNESGHTLDPVMKACQDEHKRLLWEQTELLNEGSSAAKPKGKSFPLLNRYVELKVVSDIYFRKWKQCEHEALAAAGELNEYRLRHKTQKELERITLDRLFRWCFRLKRNPCSVMVSGVAGVGKTTLVQKFVHDWARGKHYQKFTFVFYFKFRYLNTMGPRMSLESLVLREYPHLQENLGTILQKPENLLFIFDGLDESNSDLDLRRNRCTNLCHKPGDVKPIDEIVSRLLNQTLLKGCSVLLTSRPNKLAQLESGVLHRVTSIVGFLSQEREQYFQNFFEDDAVAQRALAHVRDSQVLYTLCYNPSYCWITCTALQPCFLGKKGQPPPLPKTVTQLFVRYVKHLLDHHSRDLPEKAVVLESLRKLGWLADYGLNNRTLVFDQNHLEAFRVERSPLLTAFLVESLSRDGSSSQVTYSFVHLTVQEFFAALAHYLDFNQDNYKETMAQAVGPRSGEYEIFLRFLSGLSHPASRAPLEEVLGKFSSVTTKKVIEWLSQTDYSSFVSLDNDDGKRKALSFFHLLFEAHNPQLVRRVMGDAALFDFSELFLMPVDCTILSYILGCCNKAERLNLDSCLIQNEGFQKLSSQLHKIKELSLCNNDLRDPAVKDLISTLQHPDCQLETLRLGKNGFTTECCKDLSKALSGNQSLLCLELKNNKLQDKGLYDLLEVFKNPQCKIQTLAIQENTLSDACCGMLRSALAKNTSLKALYLSGNHLTDRCAPEMRNFLLKCPALTEIRLSLTDISPAMENQLKKVASERPGLKIVI